MRHEQEVKDYIESLIQESPKTKEDYRRVFAQRKRERLVKFRDRFLKHQRSAINLIKRVDYTNIKPKLVFCPIKDKPIWDYLRHCVSSAPHKGRAGRQLHYFVVDMNSKGILGIIDIGSDVEALTNRDEYVGWKDASTRRNQLKYIGNLGTAVAIAPFGLLTGGKLISVLSTCSTVSEHWDKRYGDELAAISTTSLFGKSSQYNRLKEFKYLGVKTSEFASSFISPYGVKLMRSFIMGSSLGTDRLAGKGSLGPIDLMRVSLDILKWRNKGLNLPRMDRGVYFAERGPNALEFLRGEDKDFIEVSRSQEEIVEWWQDRWYSMRLPKVIDEVSKFDYSVYEWDNQIDLTTESRGSNGKQRENISQANENITT
jgi:hypothetical protein